MSSESAKDFLERLVSDREFLEKYATLGGAQRALAAAEGFDFTADELKEAKAEHLAAPDLTAARKPDPGGSAQPLYGVVDRWTSA